MDTSLREGLAPTGVLRAAINLGNPVLAQGSADAPTGVTVDLAREIARRLDVPVALRCADAARHSFDALRTDAVDIAFLAIEPARASEAWFSQPYVRIEGVYAVPVSSPLREAAQADRPGVRIGVKEGSAYDLFLTRTLTQAEIVRGRDGIDVFRAQGLEVAAGIRQPLSREVDADSGLRILEPAFMQIQQAIAAQTGASVAVQGFLRAVLDECSAVGFVADSLARSGQDPAVAA